ncbi:nicotinate-nucleotide adenylyltransferase [Streptomyces sp. Ag109_G2-15]|uniref:nicotinate-nucleotide adenylyltransferase n=1 Tax=Streptomyces sp. Ag109_G2-15 TaxID=1938850 RepID=UPI000BE2372F|nr:nicotinate-nucleotide adenylyltransferase [Streptomyces sp. Ag109_G2-15]
MGEQDMPTGPANDTAAHAAGKAAGHAGTAAGTVKTPAYAPGNGPAHSGKRRLGVMGGTFDPIHHGHLVAASEVAAQFQLDEVVFVPTGEPWQKSHRKVSPAEDRYLMTVIATAENPQFSVSRIDIDRGGPTYTVDTLRDLRALNPDADLFFITGADALAQLLTWRDSEELFSLAHFIGVTRPGHHLTDPGLPEGGVTLVEVPALAISSTDCRARVAKGEPIWYMVPDGVVRYIDKRELYRGE